MSIKSTIAAIIWRHAELKVNQSVSVLAKYGVGYSATEGLVGDLKSYSKKQQVELQAAATIMRKYKAGYYTERQRFTKTMAVNVSHYEPISTANYRFAQEHVYSQTHNSAHLRAPQNFIRRICFDARLQSHPNRRILNITPEESQEWSAFTESLWRLEKKSKDWDETRQNSYAQIADIALSLYLSPGECFVIRRPYVDDETRVPGISLQIIHPYQVQSPTYGMYYPFWIVDTANNSTVKVSTLEYLETLPNQNYIDSGIEYNQYGQEVAIFIAPDKFTDPWIRIPVKTRDGFQQVLHCFIQKKPGEKRGISETAFSYHEYLTIADLMKFELESARLNTVIAGTVTADSNAAPNGKTPMKFLGDRKAAWDNLEDDGTGVELAPYKEPGYSVRQVTEGGFVIQNFTPGYKYQELSTARPNINIPEYIDRLLEYLHPADFGCSIVTVKQRFDNSYNASKGAIDLTWKNGIEYFLKQFESDFHRPNYTAWLNAKVAAGIIMAPGWDKPLLRLAWSDMSIITPPKPSLNPSAEANAAKTRCDEGVSNREYESQQITGTSAEENAERLAFENSSLAIARNELNQQIGSNTGE